ncbi:phosphoribosylanthranilate isomerase [Aequorivita sp. F47161]|uniref:N-(5'-phosphoribosyl)anthranilate isomerase n=1 Tax=Aequorivita vitellina TaxID=2874475 RepID=A0A9X1QWT6_9FLAO|nr:phosphoribosylanthranilate isomerase [Aequorivita vitellina]MCG2419274.1 phosphoribosylanthranilate isomerase [Aequorivita vitellina]
MKTLLKVCGMKHNVAEVAELQPDYLGFIFYEKSPRFFDGEEIPSLPLGTKKVGIFVNEQISKVIALSIKHSLDVIQLHGEESKEYLLDLHAKLTLYYPEVVVWKAFSIDDNFDFNQLSIFENKVDAFLFDTKGREKGGNGFTFNWEILKNYTLKKPFILSGGIGLEEIFALKELLKTDLPIYGIDVNSKFEIEPGLKNIEDLKKFKNEL